MNIHLTNKIFISDLTAEERLSIIQAFTFENPKYKEAVQFGRYARSIPKTLELFDWHEACLVVPIGALEYLLQNFNPDVIDHRNTVAVEIPFQCELRPYQKNFVHDAINASCGQMIAPTGSGKTISAIALAARLQQRALVLVKSKHLAEQWLTAINHFTGLDAGLIGGGKNTQGKEFTVGLTQTLSKRDLAKFDYGLVIADECHNLPANQAYKVVGGINAKFKYGLSATPQRRDNMEFMIAAAVGQVCAKTPQSQVNGNVLPVCVSTVNETFLGDVESWAEFLNALVDDKIRNDMIVDHAIRSSKEVGTIVLCAQVRHCDRLAGICSNEGVEPLVLHGQMPAKEKAIRMTKAPQAPLIIGTLSLLSEGIDLPHLTAIIFASPVSASVDREDPAATRLLQSIGRCRRPFPGKKKAYVLDIIDSHPFGMAAYKKRLAIYQQHGFCVY